MLLIAPGWTETVPDGFENAGRSALDSGLVDYCGAGVSETVCPVTLVYLVCLVGLA
jgi:hypothetical protein